MQFCTYEFKWIELPNGNCHRPGRDRAGRFGMIGDIESETVANEFANTYEFSEMSSLKWVL